MCVRVCVCVVVAPIEIQCKEANFPRPVPVFATARNQLFVTGPAQLYAYHGSFSGESEV